MGKISWLTCAALGLLASCARPSHDETTLKAIEIEAQTLIRNSPVKAFTPISKSKWPRVIASLNPESVTVSTEGVDILVRPYFDGGWGYFIPLNEQALPEPKGRFANIGQGVYWYHPY